MNALKHDPRPLIAHVLYRFDTGGLENGVVNLVNRLPADRFRHAIVALTEVTEFRRRIQRDDVQFVALNKPPGQGLWLYPRMRRLLRELKPSIVHTRNLGALEMTVPAAWAGVPVRVHGEHGWDTSDPDGRSRKFQWMRRAYRPFVHHYVALSRHLERYLVGSVGIAPGRLAQIYNGVDAQRFQPAAGGRGAIAGSPFNDGAAWHVGTVGRLSPVKDQVLLARAFVRALELAPEARQRLRLVIVGEGPLRPQIEQVLRERDAAPLAWLAGDRSDVPDVLRGLDAFALPSLAEGISNTILEAMASALPIVATDVGGNAELLAGGMTTGCLVPPANVEAMAAALLQDFQHPEAARERGRRARAEVQRRFSLDAMVGAYADLYDGLLARAASQGTGQHRFT